MTIGLYREIRSTGQAAEKRASNFRPARGKFLMSAFGQVVGHPDSNDLGFHTNAHKGRQKALALSIVEFFGVKFTKFEQLTAMDVR